MKYVLDGTKVVECELLFEWADWLATADRTVAKTSVGDVTVSTVFLGLDFGFDERRPLVFETLVFGGTLDGEMERYATWDEAVAGHEKMVLLVKDAEDGK